MAPSLSIVVTTYEWPDALAAVLRALADQGDPEFDVVVADDGSGPATARVVDQSREILGDRLSYVWQPDQDYRLARVRNLGALSARGEYLVFVDGDCVPRQGFVRAMKRAARPGWFVAGRRVWLSRDLTERVVAEQAPVHRWSTARWFVRARKHAGSLKVLTPRDRRVVGNEHPPEFEPHNRAFGPGFGISRADFVALDGYDMRYVGWGEEDVDLAVRARRLGLRCGHAGPHAALLHLWHPTRMVRDRPNWYMLQETEGSSRIVAIEGVGVLERELLASAHVGSSRGADSNDL
jgi:glycosyltransferase involved in cell wall biosynthesis